MTKTSPTLHSKTQKLSALLEKMGAYLQTHQHPKTYQPITLSDKKGVRHNVFYQQKSVLGSHLFGQRAGLVQSLATKLLPKGVVDDWSETLYLKLANIARAWALHGLRKDTRFVELTKLSDEQKQDFAQDIANQNRALATLGGLSGIFGLKGVVLDTAWLLMVSLRSVYQLAWIYDTPLSGKDGIGVAYEILSGANLDKLQQKQVVLTALALGDTVLINAQNIGLKDAFSKLMTSYPLAGAYNKQFDELAKHINLDGLNKYNPRWLHYILPITAVVIGGYYNNELIDEILGVTQATFKQRDLPRLPENTQLS